jgi:hypothetical protein
MLSSNRFTFKYSVILFVVSFFVCTLSSLVCAQQLSIGFCQSDRAVLSGLERSGLTHIGRVQRTPTSHGNFKFSCWDGAGRGSQPTWADEYRIPAISAAPGYRAKAMDSPRYVTQNELPITPGHLAKVKRLYSMGRAHSRNGFLYIEPAHNNCCPETTFNAASKRGSGILSDAAGTF